MHFMRWSWLDFCWTPPDVIEAVLAEMEELNEREELAAL